MTRQSRMIIGAAVGAALIGVFIFITGMAIIGISVMAAQPEGDAAENTKPKSARSENDRKLPKTSAEETEETNEASADFDKTDSSEETEAADLDGTLAPELVGKWMWSEGSRQTDGTGKTKYGGGSWHTYEFAADGTVKYTMKKDLLTIMQCQINELKTGRGKAVSDGETLTISFGEMQDTGTNSCGGNFDKKIPAETVKLKYELKTEYQETQLCITSEDGERCFQKNRE